jgi:hypothetical protein
MRAASQRHPAPPRRPGRHDGKRSADQGRRCWAPTTTTRGAPRRAPTLGVDQGADNNDKEGVDQDADNNDKEGVDQGADLNDKKGADAGRRRR